VPGRGGGLSGGAVNGNTVSRQDDLIRPFQVEGAGIRGRMVRLGPVVDEILRRHDYPAPVARMLGQALALATVLAGALKFDGVFSLQTKGDGPIPMMVADFRSPGRLRGYAQFDAEAIANLERTGQGDTTSVQRLLGTGYIAFTVDPATDMDRYQGIVALEGASLADCAHQYFRESEQIGSGIRIAADLIAGPAGDSAWRAGAIMLQRLPEGDPAMLARGAEPERPDEAEDAWRRAVMLLASASDAELTAADLDADSLLYRLYHEDGVRVYEPVPLSAGCRCSEERARAVMASLPPDELPALAEDGDLVVTCEFCNAVYRLALAEFVATH